MTDQAKSPRVIVALDYAGADDARAFVARVTPGQCRLKVGLELFAAAGPAFVRELVDAGFDVFLDLKFHDIPHTVAQACKQAAALGVWMFNVHALGGPAMLRAAREAIEGGRRRPLLIAVTMLTSHSSQEMADIGLPGAPQDNVLRLARLSQQAGLDGVVCSAQEAATLRRELGPDFVLVTPGIRPAGAQLHDQQRVLTPRAAIAQGADYLVIGRPITQSADPHATLAAIASELDSN